MLKLVSRMVQGGLVVGATANETTGAITGATGVQSQEMLVGVIVMALAELVIRWVSKRLAA